ncbi:MAG: hypothetical protein KIT82_14805 [Bradyrhizobium sp.]|nr:hypothetical protein [Bradyrhizobium sp.]
MPAVIAAGLLAAPACASEVDTEHLFGFSEGADIGKKGEGELEAETIVRQGKAAGQYGALSEALEVKYVFTDRLRLGGRATFSYHGISGVPGLPDRGSGGMQGVSFEARYVLVERARAPFGLTVIATPRWGRIDDVSGEAVRSYGGVLTLVADRELVAGHWYGAVNLLYDAGATHVHDTGLWQHDSKAGIAAAIAGRVHGELFLGAEVRYFRVYDGLGFDRYAGEALFAGPTMYVQLSPTWTMSGAWNWQIYGQTAAGGGSLNLTQFERQQVKFRVNYHF